MKIPILRQIDKQDIQKFIDFWSKLYPNSETLEKLYSEIILKKQFEENDIQRLFEWKNQMALSRRKQESLDRNIKAKLKVINMLKTQDPFTLSEFHYNFEKLSAVWKIFLLHIIKPDKYPIYDQNINRTYNFIHGLEYKNLSANTMTDKEKENFYFNTYLKFIDELAGLNLKTVDEAFFAFGQFIRNKENQRLFE